MHGCVRWVFRPVDQQPAESGQILTQDTIDLDGRRGMAAQKATGKRRQLAAMHADHAALRARQEELEYFLLAGPATSWGEAVAKARYLLILFAQTPAAEDPRRATLITDVFADFKRAACRNRNGRPRRARTREPHSEEDCDGKRSATRKSQEA
jgi:hypothetical protein